MDAAQLFVRLATTGMAQTEADLKKIDTTVAASQKKFDQGISILAPVAAGGAAAIIGLGIATTKMAGDFQAGITSLETGAGEAHNNLGMIASGIQQLALDTGTSTAQLIAGEYEIESANIHGQAALDALKYAAEGAKVGVADLGTVANAETTLMTDYKSAHVGAAQAVNELIATVSAGKTHMEDLSNAIASVAPTASAAGIGLSDMMGALATMTGEGVPAADAATYLRQTIIALEAPSKQTSKALADVGLSTSDVANEMKKSLPDALKMITDAVGKKFPIGSAAYIQAMKDIAGGSKQMQGILDLTGTNMQTFADNAKNIGDTASKSGNNIQGWAAVQQDFNFKMDKAREAVEVLGEKIGGKLLPIAGQFMGWITGSAVPALTNFAKWLTGSSTGAEILRPVLITLGIAIAGALVAAFISWAIAAGAAAIATIAATWPILAIGAAIAALIAIVILVAANWGKIWPAITKFATDAWHDIQDGWNDAITFFTKTIPDAVSTGWKAAVNGAIDVLNFFIGFLDGLHVKLPNGATIGFNIPKIPHMAEGGNIMQGGTVLVGDKGPELLQLPAGARVTPLSGNQQNAGGTTRQFIINAAQQTLDTEALIRYDRMDSMLARVGR